MDQQDFKWGCFLQVFEDFLSIEGCLCWCVLGGLLVGGVVLFVVGLVSVVEKVVVVVDLKYLLLNLLLWLQNLGKLVGVDLYGFFLSFEKNIICCSSLGLIIIM